MSGSETKSPFSEQSVAEDGEVQQHSREAVDSQKSVSPMDPGLRTKKTKSARSCMRLAETAAREKKLVRADLNFIKAALLYEEIEESIKAVEILHRAASLLRGSQEYYAKDLALLSYGIALGIIRDSYSLFRYRPELLRDILKGIEGMSPSELCPFHIEDRISFLEEAKSLLEHGSDNLDQTRDRVKNRYL